ncbi:MAG: transposase, partial [Candidatus Competibacteraceae bacterium]|nr:transposase [Candidatus Competibacteraceae bacterium]
MGTIRQLATEIEAGLRAAHPTLRKTVRAKLALAVGAILEAQTPNTVELANLLPLETERQDMREQWLRRLLKNPLLSS